MSAGGIRIKLKDNNYQSHNTQNSSDNSGITFSQSDVREDAAPIPIMVKSDNKNQDI